jgi:hypothetical protein
MWHNCHLWLDHVIDKGLQMLVGDDPLGLEMDNYYQ